MITRQQTEQPRTQRSVTNRGQHALLIDTAKAGGWHYWMPVLPEVASSPNWPPVSTGEDSVPRVSPRATVLLQWHRGFPGHQRKCQSLPVSWLQLVGQKTSQSSKETWHRFNVFRQYSLAGGKAIIYFPVFCGRNSKCQHCKRFVSSQQNLDSWSD